MRNSGLVHSNSPGIGENLASAMNFQMPSKNQMVTDGIQNWYNEIKNYNFASGRGTGVTGHFTQVRIWKNTVPIPKASIL